MLLRINESEKAAVGGAILISMVWNFILNRRFSFSYARGESIVKQFFAFVAACAVGAVVNYFTTINVWQLTKYKQLRGRDRRSGRNHVQFRGQSIHRIPLQTRQEVARHRQ